MRIAPVGDAIVVEVVKTERVTAGGIIVPETDAKKRDLAATKARVVAVGPLAFREELKHDKEFGGSPRVPVVGDTVLMGKYAGYDIKVGDDEYRVIWDNDIAAILEENDD